MNRLLCFLGFHALDRPGGHCVHCGDCHERFGAHWHCRMLKAMKAA